MRKLIIGTVVMLTTAASAEYSVKFLAPEIPIEQRTMTESEFQATPEYKTAIGKGRLLYHAGGIYQFSNGPQFEDRTMAGRHNPTIDNPGQVGLLGACFKTGEKFPDGRPVFHCRVLNRNGRLESTDHGGSGEFYDGEYLQRGAFSTRVINGVVQ